MFDNATQMRDIFTPTFHYKICEGDIENGTITFFSFGYPLYQCSFPWDYVTEEMKTRLSRSVVLTDELKAIRKRFTSVENCSSELIWSFQAISILAHRRDDLTVGAISNLNTEDNIEVFSFVSAAGYDNLFFVLSHGKEQNTFDCVEVHKSKEIIYRPVILHKKQLKTDKWQGNSMSLSEAKAKLEKKYHEIVDDSINMAKE